MRSLNIRNLSNVYSKVTPSIIERELRRTIEYSKESVSGIEIILERGTTEFILITPPFIRNNTRKLIEYKKPIIESATLYEGYQYYPFFLPIYDTLNGEFIEQVGSLSYILNDFEYIYIQWLFTKTSNWQDTAIGMYSSYILGNDNPLPFKAARKFQDKALKIFNRIGSFDETRSYIEEAEQKITSDGYRFQLRIAIDSDDRRQEYLVGKVEELLHQYTSYNAIQLTKMNGKSVIQQMNDCIITPDTRYQILSMREILSIFGGNDIEFEEVVVETPQVIESNITSAIELLPDYPTQMPKIKDGLVQDIAEALKRLGITSQARIYNESITSGVRLTVVQFDIPKDKNISNLTSKTKDIQAVLGVNSLSIEQGNEPNTVKFSIPNEVPSIISLRTLLEQESFKEYNKSHPLAFVSGVNEVNEPINLSLAELPHLLVAGTTGSGKSVFINTLAVTLMLMNTPQELRIVMIDPKQVEFQHFSNFPHAEVITDMDKAESILDKLTDEMEARYSTFLKAGTKRIDLYNQKILDPESPFTAPLMPYLTVIIDEYADLQMTHPKVEDYIARLGFKARAAGIHLVVATQRPSADVINSKIKSNILNAISFNLGNSNNYKTVFGHGINGVNLLGRGDGMMKITSYPKDLQRFQSPILTPNEIEEEEAYKRLADYLNKHSNISKSIIIEDSQSELDNDELQQEDDNLTKLKRIIAETKKTKSVELRKLLGVKNETMSKLMNELIEEGWMKKESNSKGYELIISDEELEKWKNKNEKNTPQSK